MTRRSPNACAPIGDRDEPRAPVALCVQSARAWSGESHALFRGFHWPVWNIRKSPPQSEITVNRVAEKPGFEPGRRLSHPTPLAGEPLRPLGYFSMTAYGERGIRTPGAFRHHWFSRPAPSTTRPSLLEPALFIIHRFLPFVNPCFEFFEENRKTSVGFRRPWIPTSASVPPPSFS